MPKNLINICPVCNKQTELTQEDFERGTFTCSSCYSINKIDTKNIQSDLDDKKPKRKAILLPKPVCYFISLLQSAIVALSFYGLFTLPQGIAYTLFALASIIAYWLQKIKMGYNPFISNNEYEVNPKDVLMKEEDPFMNTIELHRLHKAEEKAGRKFSMKEWDEYYEEYMRKHPPTELTWENLKNKFLRKKNSFLQKMKENKEAKG